MSIGLVELIGEVLERSDGDGLVATPDALASKKAVALYFGAWWSSTCREFTRNLAEWYTKDLKAKGLEVIYVTEDESEAEFHQHFVDMPWLAVPFGDQARQTAVMRRFGPQTIPSLVILDDCGLTITTKGYDVLSEDPSGEGFPWKPRRLSELLERARVLDKDGREMNAQEIARDASAVALYFSSRQCMRCRAFTEDLARWYSQGLKSQGLEVVFVSWDQSTADFEEHYMEMPWLTLDYSDRRLSHDFGSTLRVDQIPKLVVLDSTLRVVNRDGVTAAQMDPTGRELPWRRKAVNNMPRGSADMDEVRTVVAFCETQDAAQQHAIGEVLRPFGERYLEKQRASDCEEPLEFGFMVCTSAEVGVGPEMRAVSDLPQVEDGETQTVILALYDLAENGSFYLAPEGIDITPDSVETFLHDYLNGALQRRQVD